MFYLLKLSPPKLLRPSFLLSSHSLLSTTRHIVISIPLGPYCPPLELSSGQLARLADGCAVAKLGNTAVMSTVCRGKVSTSSFLPLTVDYRQKAAAAGRIPTNFLRRELGPSEREILTSRMIDRSVRPLAAKGFVEEVGISCNLLAVGVEDPEVLAINAASMALAMSSLPWQGAVGAVRVGWAGGRVLINPARRELGASEVNLVVVGTSEGKCTMMEGEAKCVKDTKFLECVRVGLEYCAEIAGQIDMVGRREGKEKVGGGAVSGIPMDMVEEVKMLAKGRLRSLYTDYTLDKLGRDKMMFHIRDDIVSRTRGAHPDWEAAKISEAFSGVSSEMVRDLIFDENIRVDGRGLTDIRPISCQVNLHHPLHGSALFQRGQTQVMCTTALDSLHSAMKLDPMTVITGGLKEKNFLLHYEFPSYATGEVGRGGAGANRREMGHGALAEKALKQVVPDNRQFTVRLTSEVLESNGSSSMASVCGGSLALLDAGVRLSEPASGVAMGLVTRGLEARVLTDIMGMEDFLGDMDFKLAATRSGVCAIQADVKISGIDYNTIKKAVEGGMEANHKILDIMDKCLDRPVESKSCWPVSKNISIPAHKRGKFLGPAGLNVKRISGETGVQIQPEEEGVWSLFAPSSAAMEEAEMMVEELLEGEKAPELVFGAIYTGKITELLDRGVMLSLHPAMDPVLLHNSQLAGGKVSHPSALGLAPGQDLQVKYYGRDPATGQVRLSRKVLTVGAASAVKNLQTAMKRYDPVESDAFISEELSSLNSQSATKDSKQSPASTLTSRTEAEDKGFNPVRFAQKVTQTKTIQSEPEPSSLHNSNNHPESQLSASPCSYSQPELVPSPILNLRSQSKPKPSIGSIKNQLMDMKLELIETKGSKSSETLKVKENLTTMTVSYNDAMHLVGNQGTNINRIREETGAYISVEGKEKGRQDRLVELWGEKNSVEKALEMINGTLKDDKNLTTLTVSSYDALLIIGKQGTTINRIRKESGVHITVRDPMGGRKDRLVELRGEKTSVDKALEVIKEMQELDIAKENLTTLIVSHYDAGIIIGNQGTNIHRIMKETGVNITVRDPMEGKKDRLVELRGEKTSVDKGLEMIKEMLELEMVRENLTTLSVSSYDAGIIIGNQGSTIHRIAKESGVNIAFRDRVEGHNDRLVDLRGEKTSVDKALNMIKEIQELDMLKENLTIVTLSEHDARIIYGNQGTTIFRIAKESGVNIQVRDPMEGGKDRLVELRGEKTSVDKALEMIKEIQELDMMKENLKTLTVSEYDFGIIIGNQGTNIHRIAKESGVNITVRDLVEGRKDRLVELRGEKTSVDKAMIMIKDQVGL